MLRVPSKIYVSSANVDMRKSIDGLASIVGNCFKIDPFSDALFVFKNKACDKVKLLYWDRNGFCLIYKRLERGKFSFERPVKGDTYSVTREELEWLLAGLNIPEIKKYNRFKAFSDREKESLRG